MHENLTIAHISDLHFFKPSFSPFQFISKRWLGNFNSFFFRKEYTPDRLPDLVKLFVEKGVTHVVVTGDLTTTSLPSEMKRAQEFIALIKEAGITPFCIPGNHDHYTYAAWRSKRFYNYFPSNFSDVSAFDLKKDGVTLSPLSKEWWLIALDTACATSWISSQGRFTPEIEKRLEEALSSVPANASIILANHFPFFQNDAWNKVLVGGERLRKLIERYPQIKLYLHGHTHSQIFADLRGNGLPIILDSGSTAHRDQSGWNLIEVGPQGCSLSPYAWKGGWTAGEKYHVV